MDAAYKICLISTDAYPLFNPLVRGAYSDAEIAIYELARRLGNDSRFDLSVIVGDYQQEDVEYYSGALVYRMQMDTALGWKRWLGKKNAFERQLKEIDAQVYCLTGATPLALTIAQFCKKHKRALIYLAAHPRDCDGTYVHGMGEDGAKFSQALHLARAVACQTNEQARMLLRAEKIKAYSIPPLVAPLAAPETRSGGVIWVGELVEWKQPEYFFRLAATLPNVSFTLYGRPRKQEYLESLVEKTRNLPNLAFQNSVPYSELGRFIAQAKMIVNTSRFEGWPYASAQALMAGVPFSSLNVDPDGAIDQHQLGVFARGSEVHLAQELESIVNLPRQWARFSQAASAYAKQHLDHKDVYQRYLKLLVMCAKEPVAKKTS